MKTKALYASCFLFAGSLWAGLSYWRYSNDLAHSVRAGVNNKFRASQFDPRDFAKIDRLSKQRESENFKSRLRSGSSADLSWPGLKSAQVSWTWLELLQGLHTESSYEGDFSWMFSKLNTVATYSPRKERHFINMLGAFFYSFGRDHAGATMIMHETLKRSADRYNPWFWCGYHGYYNLKSHPLAAFCWKKASEFIFAPEYLTSLSKRLMEGSVEDAEKTKVELEDRELDPVLKKKLHR